jgi:hypothetical protein
MTKKEGVKYNTLKRIIKERCEDLPCPHIYGLKEKVKPNKDCSYDCEQCWEDALDD